ncbi:MAG: diguanylate cyclase [Alteromonadaceae bacterium]|nr:diguanylate cyclase [Alteromonadaceae bacterium]|tara:strand:- start:17697 stop:18716 length:1020 start_codon:yes stop_codon:yes gene_type:complete
MGMTGKDTTEILRRRILRGLTLIIAFAAALVTLANVLKGYWLLATLDLMLCLFCTVIAWHHHKGHYQQWHSYAVMFLYILANSVVSMFGGLLSGLPFWLLTFPILLYLLFGKRVGLVGSAALLLIEVNILYFNTQIENTDAVISILINFVLAYIVIWVISHSYEMSRKSNEKKLVNLALRDALTQTYNRLALQEHFSQYLDKDDISVALLDIDDFKQINDRFGHDVGDCVLLQLSKLVRKTVGDDQVYRIGGEEFVVLFKDCTMDSLVSIIESLRHTIQHTQFGNDTLTINITISIGVSEVQDGTPLSQHLKQADERLYCAKRKGKNQAVFISTAPSLK